MSKLKKKKRNTVDKAANVCVLANLNKFLDNEKINLLITLLKRQNCGKKNKRKKGLLDYCYRIRGTDYIFLSVIKYLKPNL